MLKATGYSSLFSLGLSAPHTHYPHAVSPLPSPLPTPTTPQSFTFNICSSDASSSSQEPRQFAAPPKIRINTQVASTSAKAPFSAIPSSGSQQGPIYTSYAQCATPKTNRRRRSSLSATASPKGGIGIKSPTRAAGASFKSAVLMSPGKARAELADEDEVTASRGIMQRLRSVSIAGGLRMRRRAIPNQHKAPPTIPLPSLPPAQKPSSPTRTKHISLPATSTVSPKPALLTPLPVYSAPPTRPVTRRILTDTTVNVRASPPSVTVTASLNNSSFGFGSPVLNYLAPDFAFKLALAMATPPASNASSPVEGRSYFDADDAGMRA